MSSDPMELIANMLRNTDLNQQILSGRGTTNQTIHPNQGALSSDGPNVSQTFQVANSNINQRSYSINLIGSFNLGARASTIGDHGTYLDQQDSRSTTIKYTSRSGSKASKFVGSSSVQRFRSSDLSANRTDFNAKIAAVKESTVELGESTAELNESTVELAEVTAKLSEAVTTLDWPTFKLGGISESAVDFGDSTVQQCMSTINFSRLFIDFGRVGVTFGETITAIGKSISRVVFDDASTLKLGEDTAGYRKSCTSYMEVLARFGETADLSERSRSLEKSIPQLRELIGSDSNLDEIEEIAIGLGESANMFSDLLTAFGESVIAYSKAIAALDDFLAALNHQNQ